LGDAQTARTEAWVRNNPELAASLRGKDCKSQYEHVRARSGFKKAKAFILHKARASSVPAHRFKFLWVSGLGTKFERLRLSAHVLMSLTGPVSSQFVVFRGA
jgi:hypothetical protein